MIITLFHRFLSPFKGRSHGCTDLVDKIKLPREPRKKKPTEGPKTSPQPTTLLTEKAIVYIDPNCHKNLVDMYCERLESNFIKYLYNNSIDEGSLLAVKLFQTGLNEATCKKLIKHNQCLVGSFRMRCEQSMGQAFLKVDRLLQQCMNYVKMAKSRQSRVGASWIWMFSTFVFIYIF